MRRQIALAMLMIVVSAGILRAEKGDYLTDAEADKLRDAQDPSERIGVFLEFAQARLARIDEFRHAPEDSKYDTGPFLDRLMGQYVSITDELKSWIQTQYDHRADMRRGLRKLLEAGPKQLEQLSQMQKTPDVYAADYASSLHDAVADFSDLLDGATKALAGQEKYFGALKRDAKVEAHADKERLKEEKKKAKEERKLRKHEHKSDVPADIDDQ
jgi:hypothetical protein